MATVGGIAFQKFHGAGNDFIIINNVTNDPDSVNKLNADIIARMCDRHFGIGADGFIVLTAGSTEAEFTMEYYNSDGLIGSLCGNGSRCVVGYLYMNKLTSKKHVTFRSCAGVHCGEFDDVLTIASLTMPDVIDKPYQIGEDALFVDTGSPHVVQFISSVPSQEYVLQCGRAIRNDPQFQSAGGVNVNFATVSESNAMIVRTYERGVENTTLACGTGAIACAVAYNVRRLQDREEAINPALVLSTEVCTNKVEMLGGSLTVKMLFTRERGFHDVVLSGPVCKVFTGVYYAQ